MPPSDFSGSSPIPPLQLFADLAPADSITGRVVEPDGAGVAGIDIIDLGSGGYLAEPGVTRGYALGPMLRLRPTD